ncbi:MAG TPA: hypothetical protein VFB45_26270 [Pseudolabrys sp.]|nr:hypothetical protein [Pseudolabrys sp.]
MLARCLIITLLLAACLSPAAAIELGHRTCLSKDARTAAITSGQAMPLGKAMRALRGRAGRELVRARLCETPKGLVYMLTLLGRDGKVTRATVDAQSGTLVTGRKLEEQ